MKPIDCKGAYVRDLNNHTCLACLHRPRPGVETPYVCIKCAATGGFTPVDYPTWLEREVHTFQGTIESLQAKVQAGIHADIERLTELARRLKQLASLSDAEAAHGKAESLLLNYIDDEEVRKVWGEISMFYA